MKARPWPTRTEDIGIEQFGPKHMASASTACTNLFKQFRHAMRAVYDLWHDGEPEYSEQEIGRVVSRWKKNYDIANERWGEAEDFLTGLQALVEQMLTWKARGMKDSVKAGAMTRVQMALVGFLKDKVGSKKPSVAFTTAGRMEWQGTTISFVEVFEGLIRRGYLSYPEGDLDRVREEAPAILDCTLNESGGEMRC
jgi:hypothetical protein